MDNKRLTDQTDDLTVPNEIKGWNWGAFFLNWVWGLGNNTYIALLMFVPGPNLIMPFILGLKGNEWAWQNDTWHNVHHFKSIQKRWRNTSFLILFLCLCLAGLSYFWLSHSLKCEAYHLSLKEVQTNPEVIKLLGGVPEPGLFISGEVSSNNESGIANIKYKVAGPLAEALVSVYAIRSDNKWEIRDLMVARMDPDKHTFIWQQ